MDPEIKAMSVVAEALSELTPEAAGRVLAWVSARFGLVALEPVVAASVAETGGPIAKPVFSSFHELFDLANPESGTDRALVAGYWFQELQHIDDLDSFQLNRALKDLGHESGNITRDLDHLNARTPRLVMQVRKEGSTKQARKKYRLTREGIRAVERMIGTKT